MRRSRWAAALAAATLFIGLGITNATPAAAADLSEGCQELNSSPPNLVAGFIGFAFNAGEVISVDFTNAMDGATTGYLKINSITRDLTSIPGTASWVVRNTDTYSVYREYDTGTSDWTWSCGVAGETWNPGTSGEAAPIPAWLQAYGRPGADATCETGWNASWQKWAEDVTGGWVCTRTIPSLG